VKPTLLSTSEAVVETLQYLNPVVYCSLVPVVVISLISRSSQCVTARCAYLLVAYNHKIVYVGESAVGIYSANVASEVSTNMAKPAYKAHASVTASVGALCEACRSNNVPILTVRCSLFVSVRCIPMTTLPSRSDRVGDT